MGPCPGGVAILQAPLGPDSGPELAAAVADAGGIGLVRIPEWPAPDRVRELIWRTRSLMATPFGVAFFQASPQKENMRAAVPVLEEKVAVLQAY
ncbi:hypothetical protein PR202_ga21317 [Eleusine coracana subsp. coracana]|uniref:Uncharacterized protein n=1 Tax=Eleusine coracana subsp. coracana TaxID=191504 RepID=A0AAV5D125_ELECO|nr:hypothetical protein PR202_ga21317 [Eleusine coracana subsp. coracana]